MRRTSGNHIVTIKCLNGNLVVTMSNEETREFTGPVGERVIRFGSLSPAMKQKVEQHMQAMFGDGPDGCKVVMDDSCMIEIAVLEQLGWTDGC